MSSTVSATARATGTATSAAVPNKAAPCRSRLRSMSITAFPPFLRVRCRARLSVRAPPFHPPAEPGHRPADGKVNQADDGVHQQRPIGYIRQLLSGTSQFGEADDG